MEYKGSTGASRRIVYRAWRPNSDVKKFFEDLKHRKIPPTTSLNKSIKISDKPAPPSLGKNEKEPEPTVKINAVWGPHERLMAVYKAELEFDRQAAEKKKYKPFGWRLTAKELQQYNRLHRKCYDIKVVLPMDLAHVRKK